jgi:hypothetical protein
MRKPRAGNKRTGKRRTKRKLTRILTEIRRFDARVAFSVGSGLDEFILSYASLEDSAVSLPPYAS